MRWLLLAGSFLAASGCLASGAVRSFPWIKSRAAKKVDPVQTRVAYHGSTMWSAEGRLHFPPDKTSAATLTRAKSRSVKTSH
jgi:hypothetical protein